MFNKFQIFLVAIFCLTTVTANAEPNKILITINQFISHPALDQARLGVEAGLRTRGLLPSRAVIRFDNSQGNIISSAQIAKHQASLKPDFMVAIATPAAQSTLKAAKSGEVAFVAVADPAAAGLTSAPNVIGVADKPSIKELIDVTLQILPKMKTIGVVYNSGEVNSVKVVKDLEEIAKSKGLNVKTAAITTSTNVKNAAQSLVSSVDVIYVPLDNSVVSALTSLIQVTSKASIPVIANDPMLIDNGLLVALGVNYFKSGQQLGFMISDMIEGKTLASKIQDANGRELKINHKTAAQLGLVIPQNLDDTLAAEEGK